MSIEPQIADAVGGLDLEAGPLIGQVRRLDRHWIDVTVTDPSIVGRITVSDLVAFDTGAEFLVGMIDSVTLADGHAPDGNGAAPAETGVELRATPVGAFRPSETGGSFTRGASLYPHVGNDCRLLDGDRLTRFMTILADEVPRDERLQLGHYVGGRQAIAKEGRKYGVGLFVVSQRPSDVSRTILSQSNNFIVMRTANDRDQAIVERLISDTIPGVKGVLPVLDIGEAVVIGDALLLPNRLKFDAPETPPTSTTSRTGRCGPNDPRPATRSRTESRRCATSLATTPGADHEGRAEATGNVSVPNR